jgi:peroxiredoxin
MNLVSALLGLAVIAAQDSAGSQTSPVPDAVQAAMHRLETAQTTADANAALEELAAHQSEVKELARLAQTVTRRYVSLAGENFLRTVGEKSENKEARGFATWGLAQMLLQFEDSLTFLENPKLDANVREQFVARRGQDLIDALTKRGKPALHKDALEQLNKVVDDYYFLDYRQTGYLGLAAEQRLFQLEHLQVGMVAPEIDGADEDGTPFKLSDYRGKVVALDFWGFWCPICVRNLPEERVIVAKHKDDPFALVGVNSDPKQQLVEMAKHDPIAWRSFFDGGDAYGPIATRWNVMSWPTIFVLDENGVITLITEDAREVHRKVDELLAAMKAKQVAATEPKKGTP